MEILYKDTKNFISNTLTISNGYLEIEIAKDIGPRILSFARKGGENLFFNDRYDQITKDVSHIYGKSQRWHIYGGHRLWLSPEDDLTYYPDNSPVQILKTPQGVIINAPKQEITDIQLSIMIDFINRHSVRITHKAKNYGDKKRFSLWGLTVMKSGYTMRLEIDKKKKGLLPNRNIVLWPYSEIEDKRLKLRNTYIELKSDNRVSKPIKIGTYNDNIRASYEMDGYIFEKEFEGDNVGIYPDFHCNFECYASDKIHEIESLSPLRVVEKNGEIEFNEIWKLRKVAK